MGKDVECFRTCFVCVGEWREIVRKDFISRILREQLDNFLREAQARIQATRAIGHLSRHALGIIDVEADTTAVAHLLFSRDDRLSKCQHQEGKHEDAGRKNKVMLKPAFRGCNLFDEFKKPGV